MIYGLPLIDWITTILVHIPPANIRTLPARLDRLHGDRYVCLKLLPGVRMIHPPLWTDFSGHIVVPDQSTSLRIQSPALANISGKCHVRLVGGVRKFPRGIRMASLNADRIAVGLVGAPGDLLLRDELDNLPVRSDDVMAACLCGVGDA